MTRTNCDLDHSQGFYDRKSGCHWCCHCRNSIGDQGFTILGRHEVESERFIFLVQMYLKLTMVAHGWGKVGQWTSKKKKKGINHLMFMWLNQGFIACCMHFLLVHQSEVMYMIVKFFIHRWQTYVWI